MKNERMTLRDIAGFCPEDAIWKMMADVSAFLLKDGMEHVLTPDSIMIDGNMFMVTKEREALNEFIAPEQHDEQSTGVAQMVWSLGAVAYYTATGHVVFGGQGGSYQKEHPSVALPILPKDFQTLTPVLQRCLCYAPEGRFNLKELYESSQKGFVDCEKQQCNRNVETAKKQEKVVNNIVEKWPEEMIEV